MTLFNKATVILEMANNHMGSIAHAKKIITQFKKITFPLENEIDFILKFQKRDSNSFIHKSFIESEDTQVQRFKDTFLSQDEWRELIRFSSKAFKLACTPFDEGSVDFVYRNKFHVVKVASCSANDWPLLEYINRVNKTNKKKILISLGGLNISTIEDIFSFFENRRINFNFLYCVAKYPSEQSEQNLSYFAELKKRFGDKIIGFSSHENTKSILTPLVAYGAGVRVFEKHIGFPDKNIKLNQYSLPPEIFEDWLHKLHDGIKIYGKSKNRNKELKKENEQLSKFRRGVYVKKNIKKGQKINFNDIYFAFPCKTGQLAANDISKDYEIFTKIKCYKDSPLLKKEVNKKNVRNSIRNIRDKIRTLINKTNVVLPVNPRLEISHHYGLDEFYKYGLSMINIVNDKYCKKLLILLPGQTHPAQFHKLKTESFFILYGNLNLKLNKKIIKMKVGDFITIKAYETHEFQSKNGVIIEELSTSSIKSDSFYIDKKIMNNKNRKSVISL